MDSPLPSLEEKVSTSFTNLSSAATELNSASDDMGRVVTDIETFVQGLNLGIPTWITVAQGDEEPNNDSYWSYELGYAKVANRWGIALRTTTGDYRWTEHESVDEWLFGDAPRWLRVLSITMLPDLLDALVKSTEEETKKIKTRVTHASSLLAAIEQAATKAGISPRKSK